MDTKTWRTILSYTELSEDRSYLFDRSLHKGLNSELKSLYTAVTRARSKLWIYESDNERFYPMYHYWLSRSVATKDLRHTQIFSNPSSQHEWKEQGNFFKKREMYDQALHCYKMAGKEASHLQREMEAYIVMSDGHVSTIADRFTNAAVLLLEANELSNDLTYITKASECLEQAMKHKEAALLYEKLGKVCYIL